jgi:succinoglycan biosynthesis protein ExoA
VICCTSHAEREEYFVLSRDDVLPFISVIMPVRNEATFVERTLRELVGQDYDPQRFEILVVDGSSTDGTAQLVARFAEDHENVHLLNNPRRLSSAARNLGIQHARGDIIVIVDGHCELGSRCYLARLATAFEKSGADCVGRPQPQDVAGGNTFQQAIAAARSSRLGHHPDSLIYASEERFAPAESVAIAYRRSVFAKIGGFDESFDACEDVELNHRVDRAGLRCYFTPEVAVHYVPRDSLRGLFGQLVRYGRGRVRLARKHPETFGWRAFLPGVLVLGIVLGLGSLWISPWLAATYVGAIAAYMIIVLAVSVLVAVGRRNMGVLHWLPLVFVTIHVGAGVGILEEVVVGMRARRRVP